MKDNCESHMKILAIEPIGSHKSFNEFFLKCLGTMGSVTYVAPTGFLKSSTVASRVDIPVPLLRYKTKLGARLSAMRVLNYIIKNVRIDDYDRIVFFSYETVSFALRWRRDRKVFLFEHNNIDNANGSQIKTFFYRYLAPNSVHLAFQNHVVKYIKKNCGRKAYCLPHPYYRKDVSATGDYSGTSLAHRSGNQTIIFSPSSGTPESVQSDLKKFVSSTDDNYYAICKGKPFEKTANWEVRPFFENYENLMHSSNIIFLGAYYAYRVSGVAYEALSYGKPVVYLDCPFARKLHDDYPQMVFVVNDVNDIQGVKIDTEKVRDEHRHFLRDHAFEAIRADTYRALDIGKMS